ncbi:prepilin-type N-terminal cleavage/methylation domain-containing protein [Pseudoduganella sp. FT55W]|uniref:Prepilin-type N-terminal cleavage/methylation domain-containing protein n=1 Tax=Duganella rivi TaxID=2666083 RepID=A0A7X4GR87_9BURK|nr:type II secretion system protein [Duganella rivi]MYM67700.1 prepilin-type N-terminal cleavage/methylation domain-containing protein [Duganella rivi]
MITSRRAGFSLIELLAAAAILGILATVAVPVVQTTMRREKEHDLRVALRDIRQAIDAYKAAATAKRIVVASGASGYPPSLDELVRGVEDANNSSAPRQYFLRRIPRDPFSANKSLPAADTWGVRSFDSPPQNPRAGSDVFDVYSKAQGAGLNGVPYGEW